MKKKIISVLLASMMVIGLVGCGGSKETSDGAKSDSGDGLIKVGIINNDPNESGYRTANDKDLKATFTKENGYEFNISEHWSIPGGYSAAHVGFFTTVKLD